MSDCKRSYCVSLCLTRIDLEEFLWLHGIPRIFKEHADDAAGDQACGLGVILQRGQHLWHQGLLRLLHLQATKRYEECGTTHAVSASAPNARQYSLNAANHTYK